MFLVYDFTPTGKGVHGTPDPYIFVSDTVQCLCLINQKLQI